MEQSAFEAVMIGVNVFVFIIALSAAVLLMSNIISMVNFANENAIVGMNGSLAENVGVVNERVYTGAEVLTYYRRFALKNTNKTMDFKVRLSKLGTERNLKQYIENEPVINYINKKFTLEYKGLVNKLNTYVFVMQ